ncbi:5-formyltetrahydrofolate cyclo-ligase [Agrilus planipennis]|uniref:5-formyltetrahydrofolate cyclo-ligase n=1 Tax=Agrilus planipennis TaxID=224129 RepID=A0A1W4X470_AGRPL|nr:5-formyltetrahydrofolate cyclo-ligase [Agrilus planipennis]
MITFIRSATSQVMATVKAKKAVIRKKIEGRIKTLSTEEKARQSYGIVKKILELKEYKDSNRISIYLSTDNEIDTEPIIRNIFETEKKCFVPRYHGKIMEMVRLHSMDDWENLPLTKWNIKQPSVNDNRENALETGGLDIIILPGVAFTKDGDRLGHGMGYYDKFLWNIRKTGKKKPYTVGIGFKEQIVDSLPIENTDYKLDSVLYEE